MESPPAAKKKPPSERVRHKQRHTLSLYLPRRVQAASLDISTSTRAHTSLRPPAQLRKDWVTEDSATRRPQLRCPYTLFEWIGLAPVARHNPANGSAKPRNKAASSQHVERRGLPTRKVDPPRSLASECLPRLVPNRIRQTAGPALIYRTAEEDRQLRNTLAE